MTSPDAIKYIIICEKPSGIWLDVGVQKCSGIRRIDHKLKELANVAGQRAEEGVEDILVYSAVSQATAEGQG
jgi:hypothetical protein